MSRASFVIYHIALQLTESRYITAH